MTRHSEIFFIIGVLVGACGLAMVQGVVKPAAFVCDTSVPIVLSEPITDPAGWERAVLMHAAAGHCNNHLVR